MTSGGCDANAPTCITGFNYDPTENVCADSANGACGPLHRTNCDILTRCMMTHMSKPCASYDCVSDSSLICMKLVLSISLLHT